MKMPVVALDVSGSAPVEEYVQYLLNRNAEPNFRLVLFAHKVLTDGIVSNRQELKERVRHRYIGGTNIKSLFEYLESGRQPQPPDSIVRDDGGIEVELLIVYTDGVDYGLGDVATPAFPVYWAPFLEPGWTPPFGEMLP